MRQETKIYCMHCRMGIFDEHYIKKDGFYCCEKCYFRDKYIGDALDKMEGVYLATIEAFVDAIDAREHEVGNHSYRVTQFAMVLAREMRITGRGLVDIYCGSLLHDIGKIGIPDAILLKKGELSEEESLIMSRHPEIGYRIIGHIGYLSNAAEIIYSHHEHYDGSGYPRGLKGKEVTLGSRIFSVCDMLDALTVERTYRKAITFEEAKIYPFCIRHLFDPDIIKNFSGLRMTLGAYIKNLARTVMFSKRRGKNMIVRKALRKKGLYCKCYQFC